MTYSLRFLIALMTFTAIQAALCKLPDGPVANISATITFVLVFTFLIVALTHRPNRIVNGFCVGALVPMCVYLFGNKSLVLEIVRVHFPSDPFSQEGSLSLTEAYAVVLLVAFLNGMLLAGLVTWFGYKEETEPSDAPKPPNGAF